MTHKRHIVSRLNVNFWPQQCVRLLPARPGKPEMFCVVNVVVYVAERKQKQNKKILLNLLLLFLTEFLLPFCTYANAGNHNYNQPNPLHHLTLDHCRLIKFASVQSAPAIPMADKGAHSTGAVHLIGMPSDCGGGGQSMQVAGRRLADLTAGWLDG